MFNDTSSTADLFSQPGGVSLKLLNRSVPAHTPIVVTAEEGEWIFVEIMATLGDRRWIVGWMEADKVTF